MLRLVQDGGDRPLYQVEPLDLDATELLHITEVDYGFPEPRTVEDPRPLANGMLDQTRHYGSRVITLTGKIGIDWTRSWGELPWNVDPGRRQQIMDRLAPFVLPGARTWLYSMFDDGQVRRILLRADQLSRPQIANVQDLSLSFKSPTGVFETDPAEEVRLVPEVQVQGRTYDLVFDRVYPSGSGTATLVTNRGNAPADWTARIFGPCIAPAIVNVSTGQQVVLAGLRLYPGEFVEVDSREHTVLADGLPENSRWSTVDYVNTTWWQLPPGTSAIRYRVGWFEIPSALFFRWRHTSLL